MTPDDIKCIEMWSRHNTTPTKIILAPAGGEAGDRLSIFCDEFKRLVPASRIVKETDDPFLSPAILIGRHRNIGYQAVPGDKELPPFLQALTASVEKTPSAPTDLSEQLNALDLPVMFKLYIAQQCPHCPLAVSRLLAMAEASAKVRLAIIDARLFYDQGQKDQIRSVPTLIMDDQLRWTGRIDTREIIKRCADRDPSKMSCASLKQMLEAGDAPRAARMMTDLDKLFPALIELLRHPRWSVRLGAMVTVEYLAETSPHLARQLADALWQRFDTLAPQIQGDIANVLGLTGTETARGYLNHILDGPYKDEIKEAARDALDDMRPQIAPDGA